MLCYIIAAIILLDQKDLLDRTKAHNNSNQLNTCGTQWKQRVT